MMETSIKSKSFDSMFSPQKYDNWTNRIFKEKKLSFYYDADDFPISSAYILVSETHFYDCAQSLMDQIETIATNPELSKIFALQTFTEVLKSCIKNRLKICSTDAKTKFFQIKLIPFLIKILFERIQLNFLNFNDPSYEKFDVAYIAGECLRKICFFDPNFIIKKKFLIEMIFHNREAFNKNIQTPDTEICEIINKWLKYLFKLSEMVKIRAFSMPLTTECLQSLSDIPDVFFHGVKFCLWMDSNKIPIVADCFSALLLSTNSSIIIREFFANPQSPTFFKSAFLKSLLFLMDKVNIKIIVKKKSFNYSQAITLISDPMIYSNIYMEFISILVEIHKEEFIKIWISDNPFCMYYCFPCYRNDLFGALCDFYMDIFFPSGEIAGFLNFMIKIYHLRHQINFSAIETLLNYKQNDLLQNIFKIEIFLYFCMLRKNANITNRIFTLFGCLYDELNFIKSKHENLIQEHQDIYEYYKKISHSSIIIKKCSNDKTSISTYHKHLVSISKSDIRAEYYLTPKKIMSSFTASLSFLVSSTSSLSNPGNLDTSFLEVLFRNLVYLLDKNTDAGSDLKIHCLVRSCIVEKLDNKLFPMFIENFITVSQSSRSENPFTLFNNMSKILFGRIKDISDFRRIVAIDKMDDLILSFTKVDTSKSSTISSTMYQNRVALIIENLSQRLVWWKLCSRKKPTICDFDELGITKFELFEK
ncbi:LOW QUALITY PROTEIN: hypothetical protein MXB_4807 [Myxobolus squamalis]|nr:LOW QUALITY PROTEIN: hypothetical protein MXB_4807 [Myxobolus squamalis]